MEISQILSLKQEKSKKNGLKKFLEQITENKIKIKTHLVRKNRSRIPIECFGHEIEINGERLFFLIANDISERVNLKKQVSELRKELENTLTNFPELKLWSMTQSKKSLELIDKSIMELKKTQKNYREILENIHEGYFEIDLEGNFGFINKGFTAITGFSENFIIGKNYMELMEEQEVKKIDSILEEGLMDEQTYEIKLQKQNGEIIVIETSLVQKEQNGKVFGFFGIIREITARKNIERLETEFRKKLKQEVESRTNELQETLKAQKKLVDEILKSSQFKSEFLANFSHELRTPLNAIIGFTDLLLEGLYGELKNSQTDFLEDIRDSSNHLLNLIENLLDLSLIESGEIKIRKKDFELEGFLGQIKSAFSVQSNEKPIEFMIIIDEKIGEIFTDPIRLKQILFNLLNNAFKFTFKGKIELIIREDLKNWLFFVKDTGIGIHKKDYDLVFKEFKRVCSQETSNISGTGLGLPLTKRLVNLLGGNINFTSDLGKGSNFSFNIPKRGKEVNVAKW